MPTFKEPRTSGSAKNSGRQENGWTAIRKNDGSTTVKEPRTRITTRISTQQSDRLKEAAGLSGFAKVNEFVAQAAIREAQRVLERENTIQLSLEGAKRVLELMEIPPTPNAKLAKAFELHNALVRGT